MKIISVFLIFLTLIISYPKIIKANTNIVNSNQDKIEKIKSKEDEKQRNTLSSELKRIFCPLRFIIYVLFLSFSMIIVIICILLDLMTFFQFHVSKNVLKNIIETYRSIMNFFCLAGCCENKD